MTARNEYISCSIKLYKMKKIKMLFAGTMAIAIVSCSHQQEAKTTEKSSFSLDSVKTEIAASNKIYGECFGKKDSATFVGLYTKDAVIYPYNMPSLAGAAGIGGFFNGGVKMGVAGINITTDELIGGPEGIAEVGKYDLKDSTGKTLDKGKFIVVWKQEDGKWKMHRDIWNSDGPQPAAKK